MRSIDSSKLHVVSVSNRTNSNSTGVVYCTAYLGSLYCSYCSSKGLYVRCTYGVRFGKFRNYPKWKFKREFQHELVSIPIVAPYELDYLHSASTSTKRRCFNAVITYNRILKDLIE